MEIVALFLRRLYQSHEHTVCKNGASQMLELILKKKQSRYRPGVAQRVPGS
jgi:hypothetical protein